MLTGWTLSLVAGVSLPAIVADSAHWRVVFAALAGLAALLGIGVWRGTGLHVGPGSTRRSSPLTALRVPKAPAVLSART